MTDERFVVPDGKVALDLPEGEAMLEPDELVLSEEETTALQQLTSVISRADDFDLRAAVLRTGRTELLQHLQNRSGRDLAPSDPSWVTRLLPRLFVRWPLWLPASGLLALAALLLLPEGPSHAPELSPSAETESWSAPTATPAGAADARTTDRSARDEAPRDAARPSAGHGHEAVALARAQARTLAERLAGDALVGSGAARTELRSAERAYRAHLLAALEDGR